MENKRQFDLGYVNGLLDANEKIRHAILGKKELQKAKNFLEIQSAVFEALDIVVDKAHEVLDKIEKERQNEIPREEA